MKSRSANQPRHGYRDIVSILRGRIIDGGYRAGARLPTRQQLQREFRTTKVTLQSALDVLTEDGFVQAWGTRGTFVADHPPHIHQYALIFYSDPSDLSPGGWSHFYAVLANEATKTQQTGHRRIECFYGIECSYGIDERTGTANYLRLVSKMKSDQFAGLIFAASPHSLAGTPLLEWDGVPRVAMMTRNPVFANIPAVEFDSALWFEKALDYLAARGRKRVAFVSKPMSKPLVESACPPARLAAHGLITRRYWNLVLPVWVPGAEHSVQLLMQQAGERPDALVITDDNLVEPAVAGLMAAGVRVPDDVEVVAHANFPRSGPRALPLTWLGYDNHEALQSCLTIIDQQRRGEEPRPATRIAPVFEEELAAEKLAVELIPPR